MEITNIKHFSEAYNNLREYFKKIEACTYQQESLFPTLTGPLTIKKGFNASDWDIPCSSDTFKRLYDSFIEELDNVVLDYPQYIVQTMLKVHFSNFKKVFEDNLDDVFEFGREDLVELIVSFNEVTKLIYGLRYGPTTEKEFGLTIPGFYDSFKEEAKKRREIRIADSQAPQEPYMNEEVEICIEKMLNNGKIDAIVNETIHEYLDDEDIKLIQRRAFKTALNDKQRTFESIIQSADKEKLLKRLHYLIDNKGGAEAGAVMLKAFIDGHLTQTPTREMYESEFTLIGTWQGVHNYMSDNSAKALDKANKIIIFD